MALDAVLDRAADGILLPNVDRDLLEGISFGSLQGFDLWLTSERRGLRCKAAAVLREAALASLARAPERAIGYAERLVTVDPFDENHQVVLVWALMAANRTITCRLTGAPLVEDGAPRTVWRGLSSCSLL